MTNKLLKIIAICVACIGLVLIRVFENLVFYDPFILFYKSNYSIETIRNLNYTKLIGYTFLRYFINTLFSLLILYFAFKKRDHIKFLGVFYGSGFIVLITIYIVVVLNLTENTYQLFFYIRRFLIQPIFILLLLPALYYQQLKK